MACEQVFEVEKRREIFNFIKNNPGVHLREISRDLKIPKSTLMYHIRYLHGRELIIIESKKGCTRYYSKMSIGNCNKRIIHCLRETVQRNLILYLLLYSNSSLKDITRFAKKWKKHPSKIAFHLNKDRTTLWYHINKLVEYEILECKRDGKKLRYSLKDPEDIIDLLIIYDKSLLCEAHGRFLHWLENPDNKKFQNYMEKVIYDVFPHPYHV